MTVLILLCSALFAMPVCASEVSTTDTIDTESVLTNADTQETETETEADRTESKNGADPVEEPETQKEDGQDSVFPINEDLSETNETADGMKEDLSTGNSPAETVTNDGEEKAENTEEKTPDKGEEIEDTEVKDSKISETEEDVPSQPKNIQTEEEKEEGKIEEKENTEEITLPAEAEAVEQQTESKAENEMGAAKVTTAVVSTASALKKEADTIKSMSLRVIDYGSQGYGDGQMLISGGKRLLIDTYVKESWGNLNKWLNNNYKEFDIYISHYHDDHMDNVNRILNSGQYKVSNLYLPDPDYMTGSSSYMQNYISMYKGIINNAKKKGVNIIFLKKGSSFNIGHVVANVLWGTDFSDNAHDASYINNNSLVTRFTCGNTRYLNAGDLEAAVEKQILDAKIDIKADILKLNHHGGDTSNTYAFIKAVAPSFCYYNYCGDSPSKYAPNGSWARNSVLTAEKFANVASVRYNGEIVYKVYDDVICQELQRNYVVQKVRIYDKTDKTNLKGIIINQLNKSSRKYASTTAAKGKYTSSFALAKGTHEDDGWLIGNGRLQYYAKNNTIFKGWKKIDGSLYHFDEKTSKVDVGWKTFGKNRFYFFWSGKAAIGPASISGKTYLFNENGQQVKAGWKTVKGKSYYADPKTGTVYTGIRKINGKNYYFKPDGSLTTARGFQKIGNSTYYICKDGSFKTGWLGVNEKLYYTDLNTGKVCTGIKKVNRKYFCFRSDGSLVTARGFQKIGNNTYYVCKDNSLKTGWLGVNGKLYYTDLNTGKVCTGIKKVNRKYFCFRSDGSLVTARGFQKIGNNTYYVCKDNSLKTGWLGVNGKLYYTDLNTGKVCTGIKKVNRKYFCFRSDGSLVTARGFQKIGNNTYYVCKDNSLKTGWLMVSGKLFYMGPDGAMRTGLQTINKRKYLFSEKGELL